MSIKHWEALTEFADSWGVEALSRLIRAERKMATSPAHMGAEVKCFSANYFPGLLQTKGYVAAMCRGRMPQIWEQHNITLRMLRQRFLQISGVMQRFLVHEAALIFRPNGFSEVLGPQLEYAINELTNDMRRYKTLDFRVIPSAHFPLLPADVHQDTFTLYCTGDAAEGFTEPWYRSDAAWDTATSYSSIEVMDAAGTAHLEHSWEQLGSVALTQRESLEFLRGTLRHRI